MAKPVSNILCNQQLWHFNTILLVEEILSMLSPRMAVEATWIVALYLYVYMYVYQIFLDSSLQHYTKNVHAYKATRNASRSCRYPQLYLHH